MEHPGLAQGIEAVTDAAGNHGAAYARSYVLDTVAPTATLGTSTPR